MASVVAVLLAACSTEPFSPSGGGSGETVYLTSPKPALQNAEEDPQTRTFWNKATSIQWTAGDNIKVLAFKDGQWLASDASPASGGGEFVLSPTSVPKDTALTSFAVPEGFLKTLEGKWQFYGFYPASALLNSQMNGSDKFSFRIPPRQVPVIRNAERSFDPDSDVLFGSTDEIESLQSGASYGMHWDRVVAHLCLSIKDIPLLYDDEVVKSLKFTADDSATLSGEFSYDISSGAVTAVNAKNSVELVVSRANLVHSQKGIGDVWVSVFPQTVTSFAVSITTDRAVYSKSWKNLELAFKKNSRNTLAISMTGAAVESSSSSQVDDPYITMKVDTCFRVYIPQTIIAQYRKDAFTTIDLCAPEVDASSALDLHLEIFPMYAFGSGNESGDYYYVEGSLRSHNADLFAKRNYKGVAIYGWYPSVYALDFQLLSEEGSALSGADQISFLQTPEPSSTISDWVYRKGMSFSVGPQLTFGMTRPKLPRNRRSWKTTIKGWVQVGFSWFDNSTQVLPDQTIEMSTDALDRSVHYKFKTMNDDGGYAVKYIPEVFRTDQQVDFCWVWHVRSGVSCVKDNDFGQLKMRVGIQPTYKSLYQGTYVQLAPQEEHFFEGRSTYETERMEFVMDMPSINRVPAGTVNLKFDTAYEDYFMTDIQVYREGEYALEQVYDSYPRSIYKDESLNMTLRHGTYDITFTVKDDEDYHVVYRRIIRGVKVDSANTVYIASSDGDNI